MKLRYVEIYPGNNNQPPAYGQIPVIDGVRDLVAFRHNWTHDGVKYEGYGCVQYALEQEIDGHILEFMVELMPYIEWLKEQEQGHKDYVEKAFNAALTRRNSIDRRRITGARIMGSMAQRYRKVSEALLAKSNVLQDLASRSGFELGPLETVFGISTDKAERVKLSVEVHPYNYEILLLMVNRCPYACVAIYEDGTYSAGWADGSYYAEGESRTNDPCLVVEQAVKIAEANWLEAWERRS